MSNRRKNRKEVNIKDNRQSICYLDIDAYEPVSVSSVPAYEEIKWTIMVGLMALCGALAVIFGIMDNSKVEYDTFNIIVKLSFFSIISSGLICFLREKKNLAYSIIAIYMLLRIYANWDAIKEGMLELADNIASQIDNNYSGVDDFVMEASKIDLMSDALVILGMIWIFIFLFINRKKIEVGISYLFILPFVIGILIISVYLSMHFLIFISIYLITLLIADNGIDGRKIISKKVSFGAVIYGTALILIVVLCANILTPKAFFNEEKMLSIKRNVTHKIEGIINRKISGGSNSKFGALGNGFNGGNIDFNTKPVLGNVSELNLTDNVELKMFVDFDNNKKINNRIYLKGKTYSSYIDNHWEVSNDPINQVTVDDVKYPNYYPLAFDDIVSDISSFDDNYASGRMKIKDMFGRDVAFYPYYMLLDMEHSSAGSMGFDRDGYLRRQSYLDGGYESGEYNYSFASAPSQTSLYLYDELNKKMRDDLSGYDYSSLCSAVLYEGEDRELTDYEKEAIDAEYYIGNILYPDVEDLPRFHEEFDSMLVDVDGETYDLAGRGYDRKLGIQPYVDYVLDYFSDYKYTLSPGKTPEGMDTVDYFLSEKKGYCMYYATTATLMFRKMGIAARYVEGYAIDLPKGYKGGSEIKVKNNDSHAWTEILVPNVGWIPIEVTVGRDSGYTQPRTLEPTTKETTTKNNKETTTKSNKETTTKKNGNKPTETTTKTNVTEETNKVSMETVVRNIIKVIITILTALVILIPIAIGIRYLLKYLLKKFYYSFSYFTIDRYEVDLIKLCKIRNINLTENYDRKSNIARIAREFGVDWKLVRDVYALIDRAKYSKDANISSADRKILYKMMNKVAYTIKKDGNILTKLRVIVLMFRYK